MQEQFALTDRDLWSLTPRNFYAKVEQAARVRRRKEAAQARAALIATLKDPWPHIASLEGR